MTQYLIIWNAGYGETYEVIEASNLAEAEQAAYQSWLYEVESNADYSAQELTEELKEDYGL